MAWQQTLSRNVHFYDALTTAERNALHGIARVIVEEKNWEGCRGFNITDDVRVIIAGQAALLLLGIPQNYFSNVESILVYPGAYRVVNEVTHPGRVVTEETDELIGEAWDGGPVILSWPDVATGGRGVNHGENVVLHEFAHKLDFRGGHCDGVPELQTRADFDRWAEVMAAEYERPAKALESEASDVVDEMDIVDAPDAAEARSAGCAVTQTRPPG